MKNIEDFFEHLECPDVNGIIFSNGVIQLVEINVNWKAPIKYDIHIASKSSINNLYNMGKLQWKSCAILAHLTVKENEIEIVAGESDYGSDGFLAILNLKSQKLNWMAFFDCSNPFNQLKVSDGHLFATTTNNCIWKFNLEYPIKFSVECSARRNM